jgi:hypothetical protein
MVFEDKHISGGANMQYLLQHHPLLLLKERNLKFPCVIGMRKDAKRRERREA